MTKSYNGLNIIKTIDDLYLSKNAMEDILAECTVNGIAVVSINFYTKTGEIYKPHERNMCFDYLCDGGVSISWEDYVSRCNSSANDALKEFQEKIFCNYVLLKSNAIEEKYWIDTN